MLILYLYYICLYYYIYLLLYIKFSYEWRLNIANSHFTEFTIFNSCENWKFFNPENSFLQEASPFHICMTVPLKQSLKLSKFNFPFLSNLILAKYLKNWVYLQKLVLAKFLVKASYLSYYFIFIIILFIIFENGPATNERRQMFS